MSLHAITLWELGKSKPRFSHFIEYCLWMCVVAGWHVDYVADVVVGVFVVGGLWHVSVWWLACNVVGCRVLTVAVVDVGAEMWVFWPVLKLEYNQDSDQEPNLARLPYWGIFTISKIYSKRLIIAFFTIHSIRRICEVCVAYLAS